MSTILHVKPFLGENGYSLTSLELRIRFHGSIHLTDAPEDIPVRVSVQLSEEWVELLPVVCDASKDCLRSLAPAMFPFLPLPSHFKPTDTYQWQQLAKQIENSLVADPLLDSKHPECYHLMRELFWMAFIAAFPEFPRGKWPRWNKHITMEGDFISHWMLKGEDEFDVNLPVVQSTIWEQFKSIVASVNDI